MFDIVLIQMASMYDPFYLHVLGISRYHKIQSHRGEYAMHGWSGIHIT